MTTDSLLAFWKVLAALILLALAVALLLFPYGADHAIFALIAGGWLEGEVPYRDLWDIKPPGIYVVYALSHSLFGTAFWGIRLIELTAYALAGGLFVRLAKREGMPPFAGFLSAVILMHSVVDLGFWHSAQAESFAGVLLVALLGLLWEAIHDGEIERDRPRIRFLLAGVIGGFLALLKPFFLAPAVVCGAWGLHGFRNKEARWEMLTWLAGGTLLPFVLVLGILAAQGGLPGMLETVFVVGPELAISGHGKAPLIDRMSAAVRSLVLYCSLLVPVGLILLAIFREKRLSARLISFWAAFFAALTLSVAAQGKFYAYHFAVAFPVLSLLAGWGWWRAWTRARTSWWAASILPLCFVLLTLIGPGPDVGEKPRWWRPALSRWFGIGSPPLGGEMHEEDIFTTWPTPRWEVNTVARWLRSRTDPEDSIQVIGFDPLIYVYADRRPATAYLTATRLRYSATRKIHAEKFAEAMRESQAKFIVVVLQDSMRWTVEDRETSAEVITRIPAVQALLTVEYDLALETAYYRIYRKRNGDESAPEAGDGGEPGPGSQADPEKGLASPDS